MPSPISVPVSTSASLLWSGRNSLTINTLLLINTDVNNTVLVGSSLQSIVVPIPPNGSLSVDPVENWYVQGTAPGQLPVVVVPNGQSTFRGLSQGQGKLSLPQFQSPNYVPGLTGWAVFQNGHAEFNDIVVRNGSIIGGTSLTYSTTTPQPNTLIASVTTNGGSFQDSAGNWVLPGTVSYGLNPSGGYIAIQQVNGFINWYTTASMTGAFTWVTSNSLSYNSTTGLRVNVPGEFTINDSLDNNIYNPEKAAWHLTADTASLTALTSVFPFNCAARPYRMRLRLYINVAIANAQLNTEVTAPGGSTGQMSVSIYRAATFFGSVAGGINASNGIAVNLPAANGYIADLDATVNASAAGFISVNLGSLTAQGIVVTAFSSIDMWPE